MNPEDKKIFAEKCGELLKALQSDTDIEQDQMQEFSEMAEEYLEEDGDDPFSLFYLGLKDYLAESPAGTRLNDLEDFYALMLLEAQQEK